MNLNIIRHFDQHDDSDSSGDDIEIINYVTTRREKTFRPRISHMEAWDDSDFFARYRMSKDNVNWLKEKIGRHLKSPTYRNHVVTPIEQILLTLRFYATGNIQQCSGDMFGVHKSTACRTIHKVSRVICEQLKHFISLPRGTEEMKTTVKQFYQIAKFPNVFGAIDCTHIPIVSPGGDNSELYRNRKDKFSINVQVVADADLKILDIVARWPGSAHDSTIFNASMLKERLEAGEFENCCLLGDRGYALKKYLLTPLANPISEAEKLYNESQIRTRNVVERTFGVWKKRFPCVGSLLRVKLENAQPIIVATAILHNYCVHNKEYLSSTNTEATSDTTTLNIQGSSNEPGDSTYRNYLINNYFLNLFNSSEE